MRSHYGAKHVRARASFAALCAASLPATRESAPLGVVTALCAMRARSAEARAAEKTRKVCENVEFTTFCDVLPMRARATARYAPRRSCCSSAR